MAKLVELSSSDGGIVTASWLPATDDAAMAASVTYEIHAHSQQGDFVPSSQTLKFRGNALSAKITGLEPGTLYSVKLVAEAPSGKRVTGDPTDIHVAEEATRASSAPIVALGESQVRSINLDNGIVVLVPGAAVPIAGSILTSDRDGGFLLRVIDAQSQQDGSVQIHTQRAALADVFSRMSMSASLSLPPVSAQSTQLGVVANPSTQGGTSLTWSQTGFTLESAASKAKFPIMMAAPRQVGAVQAGLIAISQSSQSVQGDWGVFSAPELVSLPAGQSDPESFAFTVDVTNPRLEVCKFEITSDGANKKLATTPGSVDARNVYLTSKDITPGPYDIRLKAYLDNKEDHCNGLPLLWEATPEITIRVAVTTGSEAFNQQSKRLEFTGAVTVSNTIDFQFDPTVKLDVQMAGATKVNSANIELNAIANVTQKLHVVAVGAGELKKQTQSLLDKPRRFVKVFMVGGVPVVVEGEFEVDVEVSGNANGTIDATETLELGFAKLAYGVNYTNPDQWKTYSERQPIYKLTLTGTADAEAHLEVALVPKLRMSVYRIPTVRLALRPSLTATAGLHGTVLADFSQGGVTTDADMWLTKAELQGRLDAFAYVGLEAYDIKAISYPSGAKPDDYTTFYPVTLIPDTMILALPDMATPEVLWDDTHPLDSRAIHLRVKALDLKSPFSFGPPSFLSFQAWRQEPKVIAENGIGCRPIAPPGGGSGESEANGIHTKDYWCVIEQPGVYRLRFTGNSTMGPWARQVAPDVILDMSDANNDGIPDRWESKYKSTNAAMWRTGGSPATWKGPNQAPVASFSAVASGLVVNFDASASRDSDGRIVTYAWYFGDGGTAKGAKYSRTYANGGSYTLRLEVTDDQGATTSTSQTVVAGDASSPAITAITPNMMVANGQSQELAITGAGFASTSKVKYLWGVGSGAGVWTEASAPPTIMSATQIRIPINPGKVTDAINVQVCNGGVCSHDVVSVHVTAPPSIAALSPNAFTANGTSQTLLINGSGFVSGISSVQFRYGTGTGAGNWGNPRNATVSVASPTQIRVVMNVGFASDQVDVRICNGNLCTDGSIGFSVVGLTPVLSSLSLASMTANNVRQTLVISGSGFAQGLSSVKFRSGNSNGGWTDPNDATVFFDSSTQIRVQMNPGNIPDTIYVRVCNEDVCTSGTDSLRLTAGAPTILSVNPNSMRADGARQDLSISGSSFISGVSFVQFSWDVGSGANSWHNSSSAAVVNSPGQLLVSMNPGTVPDTIQVRVCNALNLCSGAASVQVTR